MRFILTFLFLILAVSIVTAVGFSPTSLTFNLEPGKENCKMITLNSESSTISVSDSWAENPEIEWKVSNFNTPAENHGIFINYPEELPIDEREIEVCLSGSKLGEYHGVILMKQAQQGNSIIQLAVWLKVVIESAKQTQEPPQTPSGGSSGGGSGSSASNTPSQLQEAPKVKPTPVQLENPTPEIKKLSDSVEIHQPQLTPNKKSSTPIIIIISLITIIVGFLLLYKQRREQ
jgi:hypothetical protein